MDRGGGSGRRGNCIYVETRAVPVHSVLVPPWPHPACSRFASAPAVVVRPTSLPPRAYSLVPVDPAVAQHKTLVTPEDALGCQLSSCASGCASASGSERCLRVWAGHCASRSVKYLSGRGTRGERGWRAGLLRVVQFLSAGGLSASRGEEVEQPWSAEVSLASRETLRRAGIWSTERVVCWQHR